MRACALTCAFWASTACSRRRMVRCVKGDTGFGSDFDFVGCAFDRNGNERAKRLTYVCVTPALINEWLLVKLLPLYFAGLDGTFWYPSHR